MENKLETKKRQIAFWRLLSATYGLQELAPGFERMVRQMADQIPMPDTVLDERVGVDVLLKRHPELKPKFDSLSQLGLEGVTGVGEDESEGDNAASKDAESARDAPATIMPSEISEADLGRTLAYSKLLLNVFGPNTRHGNTTAAQYSQWCQDVSMLEECFGFPAGGLRGSGASDSDSDTVHGSGHGISGQAPRIDDRQLREELVAMESDLVKRMEIREVLKDDRLAAQLTPTLPLLEQLLYDKSNLSGVALKNAKRLIRKYVDDLADVLKQQVVSAPSGVIDRSVPPKRVFRNLDLKRTVWKNLHNFNPKDEKLYVDQLFYRHTSQKSLNKYLIVVVDQSGSMLDAMVQCAILASIFASLPRVQVSLIAFDTNVIDLTPWVADPFESLMRTNLGGGNDGPKAMEEARQHIQDPDRTTMVWISDFYEFHNDQPLFNMIKDIKEMGVHFIPVGSVSGSGYFSLNEWFRKKLKSIGLPVLTGNIKKLIVELKKHLA
ncbi:MAG: VWA domain-containing protein [Planctomycetota bacterium]